MRFVTSFKSNAILSAERNKKKPKRQQSRLCIKYNVTRDLGMYLMEFGDPLLKILANFIASFKLHFFSGGVNPCNVKTTGVLS